MINIMYILFIANKNYSSWSLRPWLLMQQLALPFVERMHTFGSASFRNFSPSDLRSLPWISP